MFQKKVGSDPCLILTGVEDSGTVTLDQTFTEADVLNALQTREVAVVVPVSGGVNKFKVDAVVGGHIYAVGGAGTIDFEETDGVWSGTIEGGGGGAIEKAYIEFANYHEIILIKMESLIYAVGSLSKVNITEASYDVPDWAKNCVFDTMAYYDSAYHKVVLEISNTGVITLHSNPVEGADNLPNGQEIYFNTGYYNQYI